MPACGLADGGRARLRVILMWNELLLVVAGGIVTYLGQLIVARFSKTKRERAAALSEVYIKLADMTAEQLEERINYIGKLATDNETQREEIRALRQKQADRDDELIAMKSQIGSLQAQIQTDARDRLELRAKLSDFEVKNRVLWQYVIALLEQFKLHRMVPVDPPTELESDPEIMRLIKEIRESRS